MKRRSTGGILALLIVTSFLFAIPHGLAASGSGVIAAPAPVAPVTETEFRWLRSCNLSAMTTQGIDGLAIATGGLPYLHVSSSSAAPVSLTVAFYDSNCEFRRAASRFGFGPSGMVETQGYPWAVISLFFGANATVTWNTSATP